MCAEVLPNSYWGQEFSKLIQYFNLNQPCRCQSNSTKKWVTAAVNSYNSYNAVMTHQFYFQQWTGDFRIQSDNNK